MFQQLDLSAFSYKSIKKDTKSPKVQVFSSGLGSASWIDTVSFEQTAEGTYSVTLAPRRKYTSRINDEKERQLFSIWPIELRKKRMKNLRLRADPNQRKVKVSAPLTASLKDIAQFISKNADWLAGQCHSAQAQEKPLVPLSQCTAIRFFDTGYAIAFSSIRSPRLVYAAEENVMPDAAKNDVLTASCNLQHKFPALELPNSFMSASAEQQIGRNAALTALAKEHVAERCALLLERYCRKMGRGVPSLTIRSMRTRWGSCRYEKNRITIALELIQYPLFCLEYVIVHELCHFLEASHNQRFWGLVGDFYPAYESAERRLKQPANALFTVEAA